MSDTWDIVKSQPHEEVSQPWARTYHWNGDRYVVCDDPETFWRNLYPHNIIEAVGDHGADVRTPEDKIIFVPIENAYNLAELKWS